jgi:hypothetical protein
MMRQVPTGSIPAHHGSLAEVQHAQGGRASPGAPGGRASRSDPVANARLEHELTEMESMLAASQHGGCRRTRPGGTPPRSAACAAAHCSPEVVSDSAGDMGRLVAYAVQLRDAIACMIQMLPDSPKLPDMCVAANMDSLATYQSPSASIYRSGGMTSAEVADLASLRAIKASSPARPAAALAGIGAQQRANHASGEELKGSPQQDYANAQGPHPVAHAAAEDTSEHSAAPHQDQSAAQPLTQAGSPPRPDVEACDAWCQLHVECLENVRVPYSAIAALESGQQPALWLTWKMPAASQGRPWCYVGALGDQEIRRAPGGSFRMAQVRAAQDASVPLLLRDLQALQSLGQGSVAQCELWVLCGPDPDAALGAEDGLAAFVGVATVPLQQCSGSVAVPMPLASGRHTLRNILEGCEGGNVSLTLQLASTAATPSPAQVVDPPAGAEPSLAHAARQDTPDQSGTLVHAFRVSIQAVSNLPTPDELHAARASVPVGRYIR